MNSSGQRHADGGARIEALWLKRVRRAPMIPVESLELNSAGIVGGADRSRRRQVTIIEAGAWDRCVADLGADVDPSVRRANVLVSGITLEKTGGRILQLGEIRLLIGGEVTPCIKMEQAVPGLQQAMKPEWRGGVFAQVLTEGVIKVGDSVSWSTEVASELSGRTT